MNAETRFSFAEDLPLPRILIVDDNRTTAEIVKRMIERTERFVAVAESDPIAACDVARGFRPDLVILDVEMPGWDGPSLAHKLDMYPETSGTPLIFITSLIEPELTLGGPVYCGGMPFLSKPLLRDILLDALEKSLAHREHQIPFDEFAVREELSGYRVESRRSVVRGATFGRAACADRTPIAAAARSRAAYLLPSASTTPLARAC